MGLVVSARMRYAAANTGGARPELVWSTASEKANVSARTISAVRGVNTVSNVTTFSAVTRVVARLQNAQCTSAGTASTNGAPSSDRCVGTSQHDAVGLASHWSNAACVAHNPGTRDRADASDNKATDRMPITRTNVVVDRERKSNLRPTEPTRTWSLVQIGLGCKCRLQCVPPGCCPTVPRIVTLSSFRHGFGPGRGRRSNRITVTKCASRVNAQTLGREPTER